MRRVWSIADTAGRLLAGETWRRSYSTEGITFFASPILHAHALIRCVPRQEMASGEAVEDNFGLHLERRHFSTRHEDPARIYPEVLLHHGEHGNKYYLGFQAHSRQFIPSSDAVFQWKSSSILDKLRRAVLVWSAADPQAGSATKRASRDRLSSNASHLFSWSSSDSYIEQRKRQLGILSSTESAGVSTPSHSDPAVASTLNQKSLLLHKRITNKLNRIVERESSRFMNERVQVLRARQNEQASKKVHERKLKDHEHHINKLREKEQQDERDILAATHDTKHPGFFGTLFRFGNNPSRPAMDKFSSSFDDIEGEDFDRVPSSGTSLKANSVLDHVVKELDATALETPLAVLGHDSADETFDSFEEASVVPSISLTKASGPFPPGEQTTSPAAKLLSSSLPLVPVSKFSSCLTPTKLSRANTPDLEFADDILLPTPLTASPSYDNGENLLDL